MPSNITGTIAHGGGAKRWGFDPNAGGQSDESIYSQARNSRYGEYGSPWGKVPPALEDHLRRRTGISGQNLRWRSGAGKGAGGSNDGSRSSLHIGEVDETMSLVEESPGKWVWTGWEDDPQYRAYKQQSAGARSSAAKQRAAPVEPLGPRTMTSGAYAQLQDLYAAHESKPVRQAPGGEY